MDLIDVRDQIIAFKRTLNREALKRATECAGGMVEVDLSAVTFMDSHGLACLIGARIALFGLFGRIGSNSIGSSLVMSRRITGWEASSGGGAGSVLADRT